MEGIGKTLVIAGLFIVVAGLLIWHLHDKLSWIGRLPGDIRVEKENFSFYIPITTMLLLSVIINLIFRVYRYFFSS